MLSYTVYSEAGGVGKTTLTANLAVAHSRAGLSVLVVPLDPQDGDLSRLFAVDTNRTSPEADTIVRHMIGEPRGPFNQLVRHAEGIDIVPEHNQLAELKSILDREQDRAETLGDSFNIYARVQYALQAANVADNYDVVICDPQASEGPGLYNALYATRNLVLPVEPSAKGQAAVEGLEDLATNFGNQLGIDIRVLGAVPNGMKDTTDQQEVLAEIELPVPATIRDRTSLFEGSWRQQCSAFHYIKKHRARIREYELQTLAKFDRIARYLENQADMDAPNPPEPGMLTEAEPA